MNPEIETFCWACGKDIASCICMSETIPMTVKKPSEILPVCGSLSFENIVLEPWLDPDRKHEALYRPCCNCGSYWISTQDDWINGTCPNCGVTGNESNKEITKNELKFKGKILKSLINFERKDITKPNSAK